MFKTMNIPSVFSWFETYTDRGREKCRKREGGREERERMRQTERGTFEIKIVIETERGKGDLCGTGINNNG